MFLRIIIYLSKNNFQSFQKKKKYSKRFEIFPMFQFLHLRYIFLLIAIYRRKKKIRNWPKKPCNSISQSLFHFNPYTYNTSFQKKKNKFSKEENNSKHSLRFDFCIFYDNSPRSSKIHFLRLNSSIYIRYPSVHGGNSFRPKVDRVISFRAIEVRSHHFDPRDWRRMAGDI